MLEIDAEALRTAWDASRADVEAYLAKCDRPAQYRSWAGNAFGLRALLRAAGMPIPVDHKGDEIGACFTYTHLHYFGFGDGSAASTLGCFAYGIALLVEDAAKPTPAEDLDRYWPSFYELRRAINVVSDAGAAEARADQIFAFDYKRSFPGKRAGTKHWREKKAETRDKAIEIARREQREEVERQLARARRAFVDRAPDLDKMAARAAESDRLADWADLVAAITSLDFVGTEARDAERARAVVARWADAPARLRKTAETARKTAEYRRREWAELEAEAQTIM